MLSKNELQHQIWELRDEVETLKSIALEGKIVRVRIDFAYPHSPELDPCRIAIMHAGYTYDAKHKLISDRYPVTIVRAANCEDTKQFKDELAHYYRKQSHHLKEKAELIEKHNKCKESDNNVD
ncbi:hypothetical protein N6G95_09530 [Pediococcus inopinatus]|uniref:hypothetical protein n=1 Tax=Pediococcus inopinatus TaxID=114090 RepID=UPI002B256AE2|nr:hypothetical protein [Pediococcus inopinatus]WPC19444.1 hypothetical protein N6G95_09530 [Pediococcus inopinatus]